MLTQRSDATRTTEYSPVEVECDGANGATKEMARATKLSDARDTISRCVGDAAYCRERNSALLHDIVRRLTRTTWSQILHLE